MTREQRKVNVQDVDPRALEYDRTVQIELEVSDNHSTLLRVSEAEARDLLQQLAARYGAQREAWEQGCKVGLSTNPGWDEQALAQNPYPVRPPQ